MAGPSMNWRLRCQCEAATRHPFAESIANVLAGFRVAVATQIAISRTSGEGQITKLKLVKRQMFGRAKLDLLQARLIGVA
jgi:transposase